MSGCQSCKTDSCSSKRLSPPPTAREMAKIATGLTVICLVSALVLGALYAFTEPVKARNAAERETRLLRTLLELPPTGRIEEVRRYLTDDLRPVYLTSRFLLGFDPKGQETLREPVPQELHGLHGVPGAESKIEEWARERQPAKYVGRFFVGKSGKSPGADGDDLSGFVIEGATTGYKARIRFFVALSPALDIRGVEILEQEEDPGLGGEIVKRFFKNQFAGRSADAIQEIAVVKDPMSAEWRAVLEELGPQPYSAWIERNRPNIDKHPVIYAITGSTISSEAVTQGVRKTIANFRKRLELLKGAL